MKLSDKMQESNAIGRATALLEQMNDRLSFGTKRGWEAKQLADWQTLRALCNTQIARVELLKATGTHDTGDAGQMPLKAVE